MKGCSPDVKMYFHILYAHSLYLTTLSSPPPTLHTLPPPQALLEEVEGSSPAEHANEEEIEITWEPGEDM